MASVRKRLKTAGHQDLGTTQRYMHLSPSAIESAIRLLDEPGPAKAGHYVRQIPNLPIHQLTNSERRKFWLARRSSEASGTPTFALRATVGRLREIENEVWRRRESNPRPKVLPRRTLHAYPLPFSHARREEAAQNRQAPASVKSRGWTPRRRPTTSLFNGIWPPTTRRGQGRRSQRIRLRERTNYPQLTDVPSDLRVNGARHASYESSPPSKPCRPHRERCVDARKTPERKVPL